MFSEAHNIAKQGSQWKLLFLLILLPGLSFGQCPTEAQLEGGGTFNVPTDSDCSSPVTCDISTANFWDINANVTLLSCATLNLTQGASSIDILGGTFTVEDGATFTSNRRLIINGATLIVNGTLDVGDGAGVDRLVVENGGSIQVGPTGSVDVGNGSIRVGGNGPGNTGTLDIDGTVNVSGDVTVQGNGTLSGDGMLTYGGTFNDNGTVSGTFINCIDGSSGTSCGDTTLPVELVSFSTKHNDREATLQWTTASELNNEGFFIEKSTNGLDFQGIGFVKGHGTTSEWNSYEFVDPSLTTNSYYRLKQVDFDGHFEYSPISFLEYQGSSEQVKVDIYPNPVSTHFKFTNIAEGVFDWSVVNFAGQTILSTTNMTAAQAEVSINEQLPRLGKGLYVIKLSNGEESQVIRLMKN